MAFIIVAIVVVLGGRGRLPPRDRPPTRDDRPPEPGDASARRVRTARGSRPRGSRRRRRVRGQRDRRVGTRPSRRGPPRDRIGRRPPRPRRRPGRRQVRPGRRGGARRHPPPVLQPRHPDGRPCSASGPSAPRRSRSSGRREPAGFGGKVNIGSLDDINKAIAAKTPYYNAAAKVYIQPYPKADLPKAKKVSTYVPPLLAGMEQGYVALYQKCVHLGCRVPWCQTSQWFECPCHGSKYNRVGEKRGGPAPRGLDRFALSHLGRRP